MDVETLIQHIGHLLADVAEKPERLERAKELMEKSIRESSGRVEQLDNLIRGGYRVRYENGVFSLMRPNIEDWAPIVNAVSLSQLMDRIPESLKEES